MPATDRGWLITPEELRAWIIEETPNVLVVNKPGCVVCHPSKRGPWSSLVGACREYLGSTRLHIPCRLDRETSGVVVLAKNRETASRLQRAVEARRVRKTYWAILCGRLDKPRMVDAPIGPDPDSAFALRQKAREGGRRAETEFTPVSWGGGYTLARVQPRTGRLHQVRVHAAWMGHPVAGDKLYGPDERLMLEFIAHGFSPKLAAALPLERQALHCGELVFADEAFRAPLAEDMAEFCRRCSLAVPPA